MDDPIERAARILELQEQAEAGRQRIAERQAAREADIFAFDDLVRSEPVGTPLMQKSDRDAGLIYKERDDALAPAPEAEPPPSDDGPTLGEAVVKLAGATDRRFERLERKLAEVQGENRELKGMLGAALVMLGQSAKGYSHGTNNSEVIDLPSLRKPRDVA